MSDIQRFLQQEEDFHFDDRKALKREKKQAIKQDRSKYKKTDQDQQLKKNPPPPFKPSLTALHGQVLGIFPEGIQVLCQETLYRCQIKGSLKKEKTLNKNLVAVGDFVCIEPRTKTEGLICEVKPRRSILSRADNLLRRKEQLIAVNIDQVIITMAVVAPDLKTFLIDRYIIAAQKGNMQPIIVINKIDLLTKEQDRELIAACKKTYDSLSIPCLLISTKTGEGMDLLQEAMKGKSSVFSGQSGAGKSSLINALIGSDLKTGEMAGKTEKGSHSTTSSKLIPLTGGGFCIDTPGIRSFGLWDLSKEDIQQYFTEISTTAAQCRFPNCTHDQEPSCAVQEAVQEGDRKSV